jgi:hypothetical protein
MSVSTEWCDYLAMIEGQKHPQNILLLLVVSDTKCRQTEVLSGISVTWSSFMLLWWSSYKSGPRKNVLFPDRKVCSTYADVDKVARSFVFSAAGVWFL